MCPSFATAMTGRIIGHGVWPGLRDGMGPHRARALHRVAVAAANMRVRQHVMRGIIGERLRQRRVAFVLSAHQTVQRIVKVGELGVRARRFLDRNDPASKFADIGQLLQVGGTLGRRHPHQPTAVVLIGVRRGYTIGIGGGCHLPPCVICHAADMAGNGLEAAHAIILPLQVGGGGGERPHLIPIRPPAALSGDYPLHKITG
jgi:hypothetical protein